MFTKWEAICGAAVGIVLIVCVTIGDNAQQAYMKEETQRIVSCNKLKEIAIAAKASEPTCGR